MDAICLVCESAFGMEGNLSISSIPVNLQLECPNCQMGVLVFDDEEQEHTPSKSLFKPIATEIIDEEGAAILAVPPTPTESKTDEDTIPVSSVKNTPTLPPPPSLPHPQDHAPTTKSTPETQDILASLALPPLELSDFDPLVPGSATLHPPEDLTRTLPSLQTISSQLTKALAPEKSETTDTNAPKAQHETIQDVRDTLESSPSFAPITNSSVAPQVSALVTQPEIQPILTPPSTPEPPKKPSTKPMDPALEALASQLDSAIATSFLDDPLFSPSNSSASTVTTKPTTPTKPPPPPPSPRQAVVVSSASSVPTESDPGEISMVTALTTLDMLSEEDPLLGGDGMETLTVSDALFDETITATARPNQSTTPPTPKPSVDTLPKTAVEAADEVVVPPEPRMLPTPPPMNAVTPAQPDRASSPNLEVPRFVMAPPSHEDRAEIAPPPPKESHQTTSESSDTSNVSTLASTRSLAETKVETQPTTQTTSHDDDDMDLALAAPVMASKEELRVVSNSVEIPAQDVPFGPAPPPKHVSVHPDPSPGATLPLFSAEAVKQFVEKQQGTTTDAPAFSTKNDDSEHQAKTEAVTQTPVPTAPHVAEPIVSEPSEPQPKPEPSTAHPMKRTGELSASSKTSARQSGEVPRPAGMIDFDAFSQEFFEAPARDPEAEHEEELYALLKQQQEESRRIIRRILIFTPILLVSVVLMFWGIHYTMTSDKTPNPTPQPKQSQPRKKPDTRQLATTQPRPVTPGKTTTPTAITAKSPEVRRDAPEVRRDAPEVRRDAPEVRRDAPEVPRDTPEVRRDTPEVRRDTPEVRPAPVVRKDDDEDTRKKSTAKTDDDEETEDDGEDEEDEDQTPAPVVKRRAPPRRVVKRRVKRRTPPRRVVKRVALVRPRPRPRARKATRDPVAAQKLYMAGIQSFGAGQLKQAEGTLQQAIRANPGHADAHRILGMTYMRMGKNAKAKQHLNTFLRLAPKHPVAGMIRSVVGQLK